MLYGYPPFVSHRYTISIVVSVRAHVRVQQVSKSRHATRQKILTWRQSLRFPTRPHISREAQDIIESLICERGDRLGSRSTASVSRPDSLLTQRRSGFLGPAPGSVDRTIKDGGEEIKAHPWSVLGLDTAAVCFLLLNPKDRFRGIDFNSIHLCEPPFVPELRHEDDTRYFEDNIDANPLVAPGANGRADAMAKDPLLHDPELLEIRKELAFKGYTFRHQRRRVIDPRDGVLNVRLEGADELKDKNGKHRERQLPWSPSRLRARALSL
jgi:hypothetical protein